VTLVFILLTLLVLGFVAAIASGKITGGLDEPASSLPGRGLPPGRPTWEDLEAVRFSPALRGYRMSEVDQVVDRLIRELLTRDAEIERLQALYSPAAVVPPAPTEEPVQEQEGEDPPSASCEDTDAPGGGPGVTVVAGGESREG
jgi:DivIVA domain-containing protein